VNEQPPQDPGQAQPGWYPDPGGGQVLRWWDGATWGGQTQPMPGTTTRPQQPQAGSPPGYTPPPGHAKRRPWPARHKVLTGILGILGLFVIIGIAAGASGGGSSQSSATSATGSPGAETSTASVTPQATIASSAPAEAPSPTPTPTHTQAPPKPSAHTVATFSGSGQENTPKFTVTDTWKLKYSFDCSSFGQSGNFQVYEDGGSDFSLSVNDLAISKSSSTYAYGDAGTHYLQINSECSWSVKVIDEPGA
jgi:hypothetical protein